jgi:hypothetical protein
LMENTTADGHETKVTSDEPFDAAVVQLTGRRGVYWRASNSARSASAAGE